MKNSHFDPVQMMFITPILNMMKPELLKFKEFFDNGQTVEKEAEIKQIIKNIDECLSALVVFGVDQHNADKLLNDKYFKFLKDIKE